MFNPERYVQFVGTLWQHFTSGLNFCTKEEIESRLAICRGCDQFTGSKCLKCGCGMQGQQSLLNKLQYPLASCPYEPPKWGPLQK